MSDCARTFDEIFRAETGAVLATLIRQVRDLDLAEDALQDAIVDALRTWPEKGIPDRPGAWLTTAARRRAIDRLRRQATLVRKQEEILQELVRDEQTEDAYPTDPTVLADDQLRLMFTCCHPALATEAQIALTLRTKRKIRDANIPYAVPPDHQLPESVASVLAVLYLIFNEGYSSSGGIDLIGVFLGGKRRSSGLGRAASRRNQTRNTQERLASAVDKVETRLDLLDDLECDLAADFEQISSKWDQAAADITTVEIGLEKSDIDVHDLALLWIHISD